MVVSRNNHGFHSTLPDNKKKLQGQVFAPNKCSRRSTELQSSGFVNLHGPKKLHINSAQYRPVHPA